MLRAGCVGLALAAGLAAAPGAAQAPERASYALPAQDLGDALRAIARASGREILFADAVVAGRRAPPLAGVYSFEEALAATLAGSGLVAERDGEIVTIRPRRAGAGDPQAGGEDQITVTGTRIRGGDGASPVYATTRRQLEEAGIDDLAGYSRILPQNYTGGQNPGIAGGGQQGGQNNINNSTALNLRGLGPDATLTLVNGHRVAYDALNQGVDISAIPLGAVERIEVIADGASALYGSDAVGGVANIILRRAFDGVEATARTGASTGGGNEQQQYSLVGGGRWSSGGVMIALDASKATPIFADQRDYTAMLDPSLTLTLRNRQLSGVLAGSQALFGGVRLELDGFYTDRESDKQTPFLPDASVFVNGLTTRPELRSWAVTPTLRADLPAGWQATVSASRAISRTEIDSRRYLNNAVTLSRIRYENRLTAFEGTAEGPLFALPGGDARLAFGGGTRTVLLDVNINQTSAGRTTTTRDFTETREVTFAYGELSLPLAGPDTGLPLVEHLSLSAALRHERYQGIDAVTTPKLGLVWSPREGLTLRGSWGRSFKVPTLNQVNQAPQGALLPASVFAPQPEPPLPAGSAVLLLGGGNADLRPERAETWTVSLEARPRALPGLRLEASYYAIDYRDRIGSPISGTLSALPNPIYRDLIRFAPTVAEVNAIIAGLPAGLSNQTGAPFDPARVAAIVDAALRNAARARVEGVDMVADYGLALRDGSRLRLSAAATYLASDQRLSANQPIVRQAGTIFNPPNWRGRAGATWQAEAAGLSLFVNHVGATTDTRFPERERIGPFVTLDLSASVRLGGWAGPLRGLEVRASALNLLDEQPDIIRNSEAAAPSYDSTNQSPVGRFISVSLRKAW